MPSLLPNIKEKWGKRGVEQYNKRWPSWQPPSSSGRVTWLSSMVMVKKPNRKWRMCMDYTDLNRACSKDAYPLLNIDWLVDGAAEHMMLSFLDAYFNYN